MARRIEIATVYAAGLVVGIALVTFPAASTIFTSPTGYGLSNTEYGSIFIPEATVAILTSLLGAGLVRHLGTKTIFLLGLIADFAAMAFLLASKFMMGEHSTAYVMVLAAMGCMGAGFGFTVPALNTLAAAFFPKKVDGAILALNALLGLGTALAPVFVALFTKLGAWWGLPLLVGVLFIVLLLVSLPQAFNDNSRKSGATKLDVRAKFPARFWAFAGFAFLYGVCETVSGNWASLFMLHSLGASAFLASVALAVFWATVTAGRMIFAAIGKWLPETLIFRALPFVVGAAFVLCACLPKSAAVPGLAVFALAGLGCSALLPLIISFGQKELTSMPDSVAGGIIAFYQVGYGLAAFGVGPLQTRGGLELNTIFGGAAVVAIVMAALSFVVARPKKPAVA